MLRPFFLFPVNPALRKCTVIGLIGPHFRNYASAACLAALTGLASCTSHESQRAESLADLVEAQMIHRRIRYNTALPGTFAAIERLEHTSARINYYNCIYKLFRKEYADARRLCSEANEQEPRHMYARTAALASLLANDVETARADYIHILQENPQHILARTELAACAWRSGDFEAAREALERIIATEPVAAYPHEWLGITNDSQGNYAVAVENYRRATAHGPYLIPDTMYRYGGLLHYVQKNPIGCDAIRVAQMESGVNAPDLIDITACYENRTFVLVVDSFFNLPPWMAENTTARPRRL